MPSYSCWSCKKSLPEPILNQWGQATYDCPHCGETNVCDGEGTFFVCTADHNTYSYHCNELCLECGDLYCGCFLSHCCCDLSQESKTTLRNERLEDLKKRGGLENYVRQLEYRV